MKLHRFLPFPLAAAIAIAAMLASPANAAPPVTTGLKLHLDASAITGLSDGNTVNTWTDVSGLGNNATRTNGAPTYETNELGGKPVVRFPNGGAANFSFTNITDIRTVFWVVKKTTTNNILLLGSSSDYDFYRGDQGQIWHSGWAQANIKNGTTRLNGPVVNGTTTTLPAGWNLISLGTTGNVRASNLSTDRVYGGTWEGDIAEVLIYNTVLTAEQELEVGGYLTAKYALTTTYPIGLTVTLTSPASNQAYPSGTSVSATATVELGTAPRTVKFFTRRLPSGTFTQAGADDTTDPYTVDLGALSDGSYEIYTTATDSATPTPATATSATRTFTVAQPVPTTTTVVSSGSPSIYGNSVTFTATVSPAPTGGSVQFYNGITPVGSPVAVNTTTGVATFTTTTLGVGTAEITADYLGYQIYETSDSALASISQVVTKAPLTVTASNSIRSTNSANPTFTYQITGYKNSQTLGTSGVTGTPSLTTTATSSSPAGAYTITCALDTLAASNYSFTLVNGTLTIVATDTQEVVTLIDSIALASPNSWGGIAVTNPSSNIAITGAGPLTLGASGINMATSTVNLTLGAPITLGASQTWDTASGRTLTASGIISGSSMNLTKAGLGTLTLSGANTYTGATIVNAGTLTVGSGATGSLDSSSTLQMGGGIFNFSRTGTGQTQTVNGLTVSAGNSTVNNTTVGSILTLGAITRTPSIYGTVNFATMTGAIKTTTGNTNTILGPWATTGSTTTLRYAVGSPDGTTSTGIEARTGTTATAADLSNVTDATGNFEYSAATTTVGDLSANTLRYWGAATTTAIGATNTLTLNGLMNAGTGTLTLSGGPSTGGIIIGSTNELDIIANAQATTISSVIKDGGAAGSLVYSGGGTLTLSGVNLYTGGTVINAGTLTINNNSALGSGAVTVNNTGTLNLGNVVLNRNPTLNGGTLVIGAGNGTGALSGTIVLAANSNIAPNIANGNQIPLSASISGPGGLTSTGGGLLLLTGANTYTGPTVINQGAFVFKSSIYGNDTSKWTPANITVASNAVLGMNVGGSGEFTMAQAATMFTNLTTGVNNNGMRPNSFMSLDTRNASAGTYTFSSVLTDSTGPGGGAVNFESNGSSNTTLELTGANTYSGVTMVRNNGTLRVSSLNSVFTNPTLGTVHSASSSLGAPTTVANGTILLGESNWNANRMPGTTYASGNLTYTGTGETTDRVIFLGGYSGHRNYTLDQSGTGLLKFLSNFDQQIGNTHHYLILAGSTTGTGEIAGTIIQASNGGLAWYTNVTKNGTGTWTLSGANTYAGVTTVTGGALVLANATAIPGGIGATGGLSALTINGGVIGLGVGNFSRPLAAVNTVTGVNFTGNGGWAAYGADRTVNLGGAAASVTWATANTGLNGRTLILGNATATHTVDFQNPLDMTNGNRTVQVDNGAAVIDGKLSGAITGISGGNLIKSGLGTLAITATSNYVGTTTVSAGTLLVNNTTGSGTGSGNVSVTAGTLGGSGAISGTVTIGNGTGTADSILAPGNSIGTIATGNLAFSSDGSYAAELNGSSVTTDVTNVTGTVTINAATTLTVSLTGSLAAGQKYFIVNNDGVDAVTGTFAGKAQDAVVGNYGGTDLKISYTGDSGTSAITGGNDIVLYTDASGSPYDTWANGYLSGADVSNKAGNNDGDGLTNLQEFAFGTQPTGSTGEIVYSGGTLTTPGAPKIVAASGTYSMVFGRRADYVAAGLTYTVQFSADLITWVDNDDVANVPVQVATDETITVMSVPFVNSIDTPSGSRKPTFARVKVVLAP